MIQTQKSERNHTWASIPSQERSPWAKRTLPWLLGFALLEGYDTIREDFHSHKRLLQEGVMSNCCNYSMESWIYQDKVPAYACMIFIVQGYDKLWWSGRLGIPVWYMPFPFCFSSRSSFPLLPFFHSVYLVLNDIAVQIHDTHAWKSHPSSALTRG